MVYTACLYAGFCTGDSLRVSCDPGGIKSAIKSVRAGGVIVFPTDTVYGIGCDPFNAEAVSRIYSIKHRPPSKPLPVLGRSKEELSKIADLDGCGKLTRFWPGPLTIVAPLRDLRLVKSMGLDDSVAVRVPDNACIRSILEGCGLLVGTSANVSGCAPFADLADLPEGLDGIDILVDGGRAGGGRESTIIDHTGHIIRKGAIERAELVK